MMRGVAISKFGGPEVLNIVNHLLKPAPRKTDLLIRVAASAVNRGDLMQRKGFYPPPPGASEVLGLEAAGVVEHVGEECAGGWKVGDRVMALLSGGGNAEYCAAHGGHCMPIPNNLSFEEAAAIPEVFLTAYQCLRMNAQTNKGDTVLIHAGASGVGIAACQLCSLFGARAVTTSSEGKIPECKKYTEFAVSRTVVDYAKPGEPPKPNTFSRKVAELVGRNQVNVVIDSVFGGSYLPENVELLAKDGTIVVIGFMGGNKYRDLSFTPMFAKRASIKFSTLRSQSDEYKAQLVSNFLRDTDGAFVSGKLRPIIDRVVPLDEIVRAHQAVERNETAGKVIVTMKE